MRQSSGREIEKATWLASGQKAGPLSKPGRPTKGTTSIGGRDASVRFRANLQIPIPENSTNNVAPTDIHLAFALSLSKRSFRARDGCAGELSTGPMKRYPRRGRVSTNLGLSTSSPNAIRI